MARQVLPIVGAVIGAYFGGPQGAQIGYAIGSLVGNAVDPQIINGPKIGEAGFQTSAEGVYRPIVYGTCAVMGNVIERGNRQIRINREQQGKGGPVTETERVFWTFAIRIAEGPIEGITRIWEDEKLVYDVRDNSPIMGESLDYAGRFRLYLGGETQLPDPDLEAYKGIGNVNSYRGTAYIVFPNYDLTDRRESIPNFRFEVTSSITSVPLEKLPNIPFPPDTNVTGGVGFNLLQINDQNFATGSPPPWISGSEVLWQPLFLAEASLNPAYTPDGASNAPSRIQVFSPVGSVLFDTLWMGDPADQIALDNLLALNGRPDLIGQIVGTAPQTKEFRLPPGTNIGYTRTFRAGTKPVSTTGGYVRFLFPHPDDLPTNAHAYLDIYGVIQGDEGLFATAWGPDFASSTGGPTTLSHVVSDAHLRANQTASQYDVSELVGINVDGMVLAGDYTCADTIRTLMPIYNFDGAEYDNGLSGYRIHYSLRGKPVVQTLTINDLIEAPEKTIREDSYERPRVLNMSFQNPLIGYAPAKASPTRFSQDVKVVGEASVQVPVTFTDVDEAWRRADIQLKLLWVEASGPEEFVVPDKFMHLVPGDCVGVSLRQQVRRMRIVQQTIEPGAIRLTLVQDRQSAYTSNITGIPLPEPTPPLPSIVGDTDFIFLDIPALNDNNDRLLYYVAVSGSSEAWYGASVQRSIPGSPDFAEVARITRASRIGTLLNTVSTASEFPPDTTNIVTVQMNRDTDEIESISMVQFLSEGGSFALEKSGGGWEILQYRDAEQNMDGSWSLSYLARGRLNSGPSSHVPGARFVMLDDVVAIDATTSMIGTTLTHRAISLGNSPEGATEYDDLYTGLSQIEFPVADIVLSRDMDTINATAIPRHRFGTEDMPVRSINWTGYRWVATDGSNVINVDSISDAQSFDVTGWASPVTITVSQLNRITGPGPTVAEVIA